MKPLDIRPDWVGSKNHDCLQTLKSPFKRLALITANLNPMCPTAVDSIPKSTGSAGADILSSVWLSCS